MKIIDAMIERETLRFEMSYRSRYYDTTESQDAVRKLENKVREENAESKKKLDQIDALSNRINEALATHYGKVQGIEMSLATMKDYLKSYKKPGSGLFPQPVQPIGFGMCRYDSCNPMNEADCGEEVRYKYVSSFGEPYASFDDFKEDCEILVNPDNVDRDYCDKNKVKLHLDIKCEFLKQIATIDL